MKKNVELFIDVSTLYFEELSVKNEEEIIEYIVNNYVSDHGSAYYCYREIPPYGNDIFTEWKYVSIPKAA